MKLPPLTLLRRSGIVAFSSEALGATIRSVRGFSLIGGVVLAVSSFGQTSTPRSVSPDPARDTAIELSPFEVRTERDDSYGAVNSTSITSFNAELGKLPISADIMTKAFMDDMAQTTIQHTIENFSAGAGFGSDRQDPGSIAAAAGQLDRRSGTTLRGLANTTYKRDGFMAPLNIGVGLTNSFDLERVEVIKGPQSLLYGNGGAGGVVNVISKQARFGAPYSIAAKHQVDRYGNHTGEVDLSMSEGSFAARVVALRQDIGGRRLNIGGPLNGLYTQLAYKLGNTTLRFSGTVTSLDRLHSTNLLLNAGGAANDGRHGVRLKYLLASDQIERSATGTSGAGVIANGHIDWDNVDSFGGDLNKEHTTSKFVQLTADTKWNSWLTTQASVGHKNSENTFSSPAFTFYSPNNVSNPLAGQWAVGLTTNGPLDSWQPSREKAFRFSAMATNRLFAGRAKSQSILGADYIGSVTKAIQYRYYQADASWNVSVNPAQLLLPNNGRTPLNLVAYSIQDGPVKSPLPWETSAERITYNGVNYVRMLANPSFPELVSSTNPLGLAQVNGAQGSQHQVSTAITRGIFGLNYIEWLDGRLNTLAGFRYSSALAGTKNHVRTNTVQEAENVSFNLGLDYRFSRWIHPYVAVSDSFNPPNVVLNDPYGKGPELAHAEGGEVGLKISNDTGTISGQLAFYAVTSSNESYLIATSLANQINPPGLNGRLGAPDRYLTIDRESKGVELNITAAPTRNWRMRFSGAWVKGIVGTSTNYALLYNDQFYANNAGQVTYGDGTVVYVRPTFAASAPVATASTPGAAPLTLTMMNTPGSVYFANPVAVTGQINSGSNVARVLRVVDPVSGPILTGRVGLPISERQITPGFVSPATVDTSVEGERTTGNPEFSLSFTNVYTVSKGPLKGLRFGGTASLAWRNANFYYYTATAGAGVPRDLFFSPNVQRIDALIGYERKFKRVRWSTQINAMNALNDYSVMILPDPVSGYGGSNRNAAYNQEPRSFIWTNTIRF